MSREVIDPFLVRGVQLAAVRREGLHPEHASHVLFQTSTIDALLRGGFDGDVTFAELAGHGDLGLGTLNALDGEMIALDGRFLRADVDGAVTPVAPEARTPFAVVCFFDPSIDFTLDGPLDHEDFLAAVDERLPPGTTSAAVRVDGRFELVHARSVPRQEPPYPPLAEAARSQHVFDFAEAEGTMVGFRFPDHTGGIEVAGHHLHFLDSSMKRGGHVLSCRTGAVRVRIDPAAELHMELPPGVELGMASDPGDAAELDRIEGDG